MEAILAGEVEFSQRVAVTQGKQLASETNSAPKTTDHRKSLKDNEE